MKKGKTRKPMGCTGGMLVSLLITAAIGFAHFYVSPPAINPQSGDFYRFLGLLCVIYTICVFLLATPGGKADTVVCAPKEKIKEWFGYTKKSCLPVVVLFVATIAVALVGQIISLPIFRAATSRRSPSTRSPPWTRTPPTTWGTGRWAPSAAWSVSLSIPMTPPRSTTRIGPSGWPPSPTPT